MLTQRDYSCGYSTSGIVRRSSHFRIAMLEIFPKEFCCGIWFPVGIFPILKSLGKKLIFETI